MLREPPGGLTADLERVFRAAGVRGALHALDLDTRGEVGHGADDAVVPASVFKLPLLVELFRQEADGVLDGSTQVQVDVEGRAPGPNGLSIMRDPVTMSLRDLAWQMIGISDNAATDVLCEQVGVGNVNATLRRLGLTNTYVGGDCRDLFATMDEDAAIAGHEAFPEPPPAELIGALRVLDPARTISRTTPRDTTALLDLIWRDQAAPPAACEQVRRTLGLQVWPHRLASGFPEEEIRTSGKTGTLLTVRNEVGVVEYPDGGRYAVAVFLTSHSAATRNPAADAAIGRSARIAVGALRGFV